MKKILFILLFTNLLFAQATFQELQTFQSNVLAKTIVSDFEGAYKLLYSKTNNPDYADTCLRTLYFIKSNKRALDFRKKLKQRKKQEKKTYTEKERMRIWQEIMTKLEVSNKKATKIFKLNSPPFTGPEAREKNIKASRYLDNEEKKVVNKIMKKYNIDNDFITKLTIEAAENEWSKKLL